MPMTAWSFHNPVRVYAGPGSLETLPRLLAGNGTLLVVTSSGFTNRPAFQKLRSLLDGRTIHVLSDVSPNPGVSDVERQLAVLQSEAIDEVLAIGGGSVLDTAKILASGLTPGFSLRRHLEGDLPLLPRTCRLICVPTTAGTGSEVTPFATIWDEETKRKHSVYGDSMFPEIALLDAELTLTMPMEVTVSTGLDAITQAFESTWSRRANPVSTAFAIRAIRSGLKVLPSILRAPSDLQLRGAMLENSMLAGLAISVTRTALCHSISYPLTARYGLPHGFACGFTLPEVFAFNRESDSDGFESLARELGFETADALELRLVDFLRELEIGRHVRNYLGSTVDLEVLATEMLAPGRADNNLRVASAADVTRIVDSAMRRMALQS